MYKKNTFARCIRANNAQKNKKNR